MVVTPDMGHCPDRQGVTHPGKSGKELQNWYETITANSCIDYHFDRLRSPPREC